MASEQRMTQAITQAANEDIRTVIMAVREAETLNDNARLIQTAPQMGGPTIKQLTFNWKMPN